MDRKFFRPLTIRYNEFDENNLGASSWNLNFNLNSYLNVYLNVPLNVFYIIGGGGGGHGGVNSISYSVP